MTICNMSIEWGARAGMIAPDETTFAFVEGRPHAPQGEDWERALDDWRSLRSDPDAEYDVTSRRRRRRARPAGDLGDESRDGRARRRDRARPGRVRRPDDRIADRARARVHGPPPRPADRRDRDRPRLHRLVHELAHRGPARRGRDRRRPQGRPARHRRSSSRARRQVRRQAEEEGLDQIFLDAGFEWRLAGCSMCLGMNPDVLAPGERCASTSNRNFEGRQGRGGRTHLVSPQMAAAAALHGHFVDVRALDASRCRHEAASRSSPGAWRSSTGPDVDTDQIIPKQFLKRIERTGYGEFLFFDWRFDEDGNERPGFELNRPSSGARRSSSPGGTSAAGRRGSTPPGRCRTTASTRHRALVRRHLPHERGQERAARRSPFPTTR